MKERPRRRGGKAKREIEGRRVNGIKRLALTLERKPNRFDKFGTVR